MGRAGAVVLIGALVVAGAVAAGGAAWWLGGDDVAAGGASTTDVAAPPTAEPVDRPARAHVDPSATSPSSAEGEPLPDMVHLWAEWICLREEVVRDSDGVDLEWWDFPLDDVMTALLAGAARDEIGWSGSRALDEIRSIGYLAAPWAEDVARFLHDPQLAESARLALAAMGSDALPVIRVYAGDEDPGIRERALLVLSEATYRRREVVELALRYLDDPDADVRAAAVEVLAAHTEAPELSVPALTALVEDAGRSGRLDPILALGLHGPRAAEAVPALIRLLSDASARLPNVAVKTLEAIGPGAGAAVPTLLALLAERPDVFGRTVPDAVFAISDDAYLDALSHDNPAVRAAFASRASVGRADPAEEARLIAVLEALLEDSAERVRSEATRSIAHINGLNARIERELEVLGQRLERITDLDARDRRLLMNAIASKGPAARDLASAVRERLHDTVPDVCLAAALAVWSIDPPATDVEPMLRSFRTDPDLRGAVLEGLVDRPPLGWSEHVVALLRDESDGSRVLGPAMRVVQAMGAHALDPLTRLARSETRDDRLAMIAQLFYEIGPPAVPAMRELADRPGLLPPIRAELLRYADMLR